jgi:hypothetical protein
MTCRPSGRKAIVEMLDAEVQTPLTDSCNALSDHGFFGVEPKAADKMAIWIKAH